MQPNQQVTFLSDGAEDLAGWTDLQNETAEYVLDWFHITMRFTVLTNTMTDLEHEPDYDDDDDAGSDHTDDTGMAEQLRREVGRAK